MQKEYKEKVTLKFIYINKKCKKRFILTFTLSVNNLQIIFYKKKFENIRNIHQIMRRL